MVRLGKELQTSLIVFDVLCLEIKPQQGKIILGISYKQVKISGNNPTDTPAMSR